MFQRLIASRPRRDGRRLAGGAAAALAAHLLCVGVAVWASLGPKAPAQAAPPPVVLTWPSEPLDRGSPALPAVPPAPVPAGPIETILRRLPVDVPPIDARTPFTPAVWPRRGGEATGTPIFAGDGGEALSAAAVEEPPVLLAARRPVYPELLRAAGITGRVVVQLVVDTLGRAEPVSIAVVASDHPGFDAAARSYVRAAVFRPGRMQGRAVRVQVRVPIVFTLSPGGAR